MKHSLNRSAIMAIAVPVVFLLHAGISAEASERPPNIVFILADDLGFGDVGVNNPDSKIPTRAMDRLAAEGMRFTDYYTGSAVCAASTM